MGIPQSVEYGLGRLLINQKGRDAKLFTNGPAFANFPEPTFAIDSPDCGTSHSVMKAQYTGIGDDRFPELRWSPPPVDVEEYLLVVEDADAPLPMPITHGLFYRIPASKTEITDDDVQLLDPASTDKVLKGGFRLGKNALGSVYGGPKPVLGHGSHRYFYQLIALKEPVDAEKLSAMATKKELSVEIMGKVAGWGLWVGTFERKWE